VGGGRWAVGGGRWAVGGGAPRRSGARLAHRHARRLVDLDDARLVRAPRAAGVLTSSAARRVRLEVHGDGRRAAAVPVRSGIGSCDGVVGRGLDEARRLRIEGRLQVAGSEDVLVVDRGCHAIHAAGDAIAVCSPLELGDLAALESACLRDGCEGEDIVSHHPSRQHQAARRRGPVDGRWTAGCRTEECLVRNANPKGHLSLNTRPATEHSYLRSLMKAETILLEER